MGVGEIFLPGDSSETCGDSLESPGRLLGVSRVLQYASLFRVASEPRLAIAASFSASIVACNA